MNPSSLTGYLEHLSYFGVFLLLTFLDTFIPLPQEIILLSLGYTAGFELLNEYIVTLVAVLALLLGDNNSFWLARTGSKKILKFKKMEEKAFLKGYAGRMRENAGRTVLVMTFIPNLRFFGPILAGSIQAPWPSFILFDAIAVILYVGLYLFLGYHFHKQLDLIIREFQMSRHIAFYVVLIAAGSVAGFYLRRHREKQKNDDT